MKKANKLWKEDSQSKNQLKTLDGSPVLLI